MTLQDKSINLTLGYVVYLLIFLSSCFPCCAKYFYMSYRLIIGSLYPTYLSYKALKQRDEKECIRLIMYWIVFSLFSFLEGFFDIFIGFWFPFYYESKLIFIFWLISPYGNGAKILYENFINKKLDKHEEMIDKYIDNVKQLSIDAMWHLWNKFLFYFNRLLIIGIAKAQLTAIEYIYNQKNPLNLTLESSIVTNLNNDDEKKQIMDIYTEPLIETIDTENEDQIDNDRLINNNEIPISKKPIRKTKRKRRMTIEDISSNRPVTRSHMANLKHSTPTNIDY